MASSLTTAATGLGLAFVALLVQRLFELRRLLRNVPAGIQGDVLLFDPMTRIPLPNIKWISRSQSWNLSTKHDRHAAAGSDIIYRAVIFPSTRLTIQLADPVSIKHIGSRSHTFTFNPSDIAILKVFGDPNILASEGEVHRRQRRAIAPAFSDRHNELVWDESMRVVNELVKTDEWSDGNKSVSIPHVVDLTEKMTLHVITSCGFGQPWSWTDSKNTTLPQGHKMSISETVLHVAHSPWVKLLIPRWIARLYKAWEEVYIGYEELQLYVKEIMAERRSETTRREHFDLLSGLMDAAEKDPDDKMRITEDEMYSNCVVMLIAGHETSAHALAFVLGELAANPEVQVRLHKHIIDNLPEQNGLPNYKDAHRFPLVLASIHEALRLYPISENFPKLATQDSVVPTADPGFTLTVPAGTLMEHSLTSLHHNPKYWKDPLEFNPERWLEADCNKDAFGSFGTGPRMCIGKRFAEVEMMSFIIGLLTRYRIDLPSTPEWDRGRYSKEELRAKLMFPTYGLTYAPKACPLVFVPRT